MNSTSALYKSILSGRHSFEVKVSINGVDYGMDVLTSLASSRSVFGSGSPRLGLAPAGELALSLYVSSASIPRMAELRLYVRAVNDTQQSEWIAKGVYYIDTREADTISGLLTVRGYDAMLKGEVKYPSTTHIWPASDISVVSEIASLLGVEEYLLAGKVSVSFNPTDMNFLERLSRAFSELDSLQEEVRQSREKITDDREVFPIARELDGKMRGILNDLFGKEICEPLFGGMNLFASSGGLPLWANLMLAITDEVQDAMKGELDAREKRIAKYVKKYKNSP